MELQTTLGKLVPQIPTTLHQDASGPPPGHASQIEGSLLFARTKNGCPFDK